jgi:hypothetical protein
MRTHAAASAFAVALLAGCGDLTSTAPVTEAQYDWYASNGSLTCAVRNGEGWCSSIDGTETLDDVEVREFALGSGHACGLATDGTAWCWGSEPALLGRFGDPAVPAAAETDARFTSIHSSEARTCALSGEGTVWCWGYELQFGSGAFGWAVPDLPEWCVSGECLLPAPMPAPAAFATMGLGRGHACGLTRGGAIWCWGLNAAGQLGRGNVTEPGACEGIECGQAPAQIASSRHFDALAVTAYGGCGLAGDGTAWCWGSGDGTPAPVSGYRFATLTGGQRVCGLGDDRVAHCWQAAGADPNLAHPDAARPHRVAGFYFDRLFPTLGRSCGANGVTGVVCWDGLDGAPEVVAGQL